MPSPHRQGANPPPQKGAPSHQAHTALPQETMTDSPMTPMFGCMHNHMRSPTRVLIRTVLAHGIVAHGMQDAHLLPQLLHLRMQ